MDRAPRNRNGNGLRMYGPGYRGACQKKMWKVSEPTDSNIVRQNSSQEAS